MPFPDVVHLYRKIDAGILRELLDDYTLIGIYLNVNGGNLLVEGVHTIHQLLSYLGFL